MADKATTKALGKDGLLHILDNTCRVTISNRLPSGYKVTIIGAGVVFHYREGGTRNEVNNSLALTSNQVYDFFNQGDGNKCVNLIEALIKARLDETGEVVNVYDKYPASAATCITDIEFGLRPKGSRDAVGANQDGAPFTMYVLGG
jgi:hypothetical protein